MADEKDAAVVVSDTENSEKMTREQLKKASISKASGISHGTGEVALGHSRKEEANGEASTGEGVEHGEENHSAVNAQESTEESAAPPTRHHTRKRSRDSTAEEEELNNGQRKSGERVRGNDEAAADQSANGAPKAPPAERSRTPEQTGEKRGEAAVEAMTSPKTKRSRLQSESEKSEKKKEELPQSDAEEEKEPASSIPAGSGFANTSVSSPFASLSGAKSPSQTPQTSSSAFAASGFGSLAGSSSSGFGAIGKTSGGFGTGGTFASSSTTTKTEAAKATESASAFGGALGQQSAFSSAPSGFGTLGSSSTTNAFSSSGFGSLGSSGPGLSSFASGKPSATLAGASKPSLSFGAAPDETEKAEDEPGEDESGIKSPLSSTATDPEKQDERFFAQDLETGEEDEQTDYSCRAKLYNFVSAGGDSGKKEWKERGLGVVRLNAKRGPDSTSARLLMRADGSHRVILNTPVKKELKFGAPAGGRPTGGYLYFMGAVDGSGLEMLQLKVRQQFATELYDKIVELQESM